MYEAIEGRFPPVDGGVTVVPELAPGRECSFAFTGHAVIATALSASAVHDRKLDGFGGTVLPDFLRWLAGPTGEVHVTDATLWSRGTGGDRLPSRPDLADHPRVQFALGFRDDVRVYGDDRGVVTLSRGLAGRTELSIEAAPEGQGRGWGRSLLVDALSLVPDGEPVFAAVSPGNARSLRMFLGLGFVLIGSETVIVPSDRDGDGAGHEFGAVCAGNADVRGALAEARQTVEAVAAVDQP
jgi:ribosomal protein S18 acetylase RimI-like enzyme